MMKDYKELDLTDNYMFSKVLTNNDELCRHFVELLLGCPVSKIVVKEYEKTLKITPQSKGIRMDVFIGDDKGTIYDLEMQNTWKEYLPKRARYYQSVIDLSYIEQGQAYQVLPTSIIIFICGFDNYGYDFPVYVFENRCVNRREILLGDGTKKVFINLNGNLDELDSDVKALYHYLKDHVVSDEFTRDLDDAVEQAREHEGWRSEYMLNRAWEMDHEYEMECKIKEARQETLTIVKELIAGKTKEMLLAEGYALDVVEIAMAAIGK